jgi:hypothetical protein
VWYFKGMDTSLLKTIFSYFKASLGVSDSDRMELPVPVETRKYVSYIICPDCGNQTAFRNSCPCCGGKEWVYAAEAEGYALKKKIKMTIAQGRERERKSG